MSTNTPQSKLPKYQVLIAQDNSANELIMQVTTEWGLRNSLIRALLKLTLLFPLLTLDLYLTLVRVLFQLFRSGTPPSNLSSDEPAHLIRPKGDNDFFTA